MLALLAAMALAAPDGERPPPDDPKRFKADLAVLCNVEAKSGASALKDPGKRAEKIAAFLATAKFGADYEDFFAELSESEPDSKPSHLLTFARMAGLRSCAFAESSHREQVSLHKRACAKKDADACDRLRAVETLWKIAKDTRPR